MQEEYRVEMTSKVRSRAWRSRWAAVGAAVAVTLGAGGLVAVNAASSAPSSFVAIDPARAYDGRIDSYSQSGRLAPNGEKTISIKDGYDLDGNVITPNVVPAGATAITYNITVTGLTGPNFVAVTPGDATSFSASAINYTSTDLANAGTAQVDSNRQIKLWGGGNTGSAFVIIDITGYYLPGGTAGPQGDRGPAGFSAWDEIPSGTTVTGNFTWTSILWDVDIPGDFAFSVDLPGVAPTALTGSTVNFAPTVSGFGSSSAIDDADTACTGTVAAPTAPAGKVCLYAEDLRNIVNVEGRTGYRFDAFLDTRGFTILFHYPAGGTGNDLGINATWAYTAP